LFGFEVMQAETIVLPTVAHSAPSMYSFVPVVMNARRVAPG
jgi:hypothetical protein